MQIEIDKYREVAKRKLLKIMFKFLLVGINAKYIHSNPGIHSLKSYAQKYNKDTADSIEIAEYTINMRREQILSDIYNKRPNVIGFSVYIWNVSLVRELIEDIASIMPETMIFLGGPEVSFNAGEYLHNYLNVKGVMIGEGEQTFAELVSAMQDSFGKCIDKSETVSGLDCNKESVMHVRESLEESLKTVKGIQLREGYTGDRELLGMDEMPFYYEEALEEEFANRIIYYESSRGCPFRCSYCLSSIDKTTRFRDINLVKKELKYFIDRKVKQVKFIDRTFNCNHKRTKEIWSFLIENDNGVTNFHFEIAADILDEDEIELISRMRPGLVQLEIGVQTTNQETLNAINRPADIDHIRKVVEKLKNNHNAHLHLDLIAGLPYEDYESFKNSFNEVFEMKPDELQLGFLKVLKGSPIEKDSIEYGIKYSKTAPYEVLSTNWISYGDILKLKNIEEMLELFYNSSQFTMSLPYLMRFFGTPFDMFEYMASYYEKHDMFVKLPARSKKYEIMLEIMKDVLEKRKSDSQIVIEEFRDFLSMDYYLREKPKKKPDFVKNIPDLKFDYDHRDPITGNFKIISET